MFKNKKWIWVAEKVEKSVMGQRKLNKYVWDQLTMGLDEHLCVELEGYLVHSSAYLHWMGVGEIKVAAEEMDESSIKGAPGQNKARWGLGKKWC